MKTPSDYLSHHAVEYENPNSKCWLSLKVLDCLNGKPWDELALAYVNTLRPSYIRVTTGQCTLDARVWRVTVHVNDDNIIKYIEQEVEAGLPEGVAHGQALNYALLYGINSKQCQWYNDNNIKMYTMGLGGYSKILNDGTSVPFPEKDE